ncbi:hypothetical protein BJX64DRAFT_283908 [Aspergillus heterothallicus]
MPPTLLTLPLELLYMVFGEVAVSPCHISTLVRTCRYLHALLNTRLYRDNGVKAVTWAIQSKNLGTVRACIKYGVDIHALPEPQDDEMNPDQDTGAPRFDFDYDGWHLSREFYDETSGHLRRGWVPFLAIDSDHPEMLDLLLAQPSATPYIVSPSGSTLLNEAVRKSKPCVVSYLLSRKDVEDVRDLEEKEPLALAAHLVSKRLCSRSSAESLEESFQILNMLIAHREVRCDWWRETTPPRNTYVSARSDGDKDLGWLLWTLVKRGGPLPTLDLLLARLGNKHIDDFCDDDGRTLLSWAAHAQLCPKRTGFSDQDAGEIVRMLLRKGADPNAKDSRNRTPLSHAARGDVQEALEALEALIAGGADVNARDDGGRTPFCHAFEMANKIFIDRLVAGGAHIPGAERCADLLHIATGRGDIRGFQRLVDMGADPDSRHWIGRSPLTGVDVNARDPEGLTPLHHAVRGRHLRVVQVLLEDPRVDGNPRDDDGLTLLQRTAYEYLSDWKVTTTPSEQKGHEYRMRMIGLLMMQPAVLETGLQETAEDLLLRASKAECAPLLDLIFTNWRGYIQPTDQILTMAAATTRAVILEHLLAQYNSKQIEGLLTAAACNELDGKQVVQLLLRRENVHISNDAMEAAAGNAAFAADILDIFFARQTTVVPPWLLTGAARRGTVAGVQFLLDRAYVPSHDIPAILQCGVGNPRYGLEITTFLLANHSPDIQISIEAWTAAIKSPHDSRAILSCLLRHRRLDKPTTKHVIQTIIRHGGGTPPSLVDFIDSQFNLENLDILVMIIESSWPYVPDTGMGIMEYISGMHRHSLTLTSRRVLMIMETFDEKIVLLLLRYCPPHMPLTEQVINAAASRADGLEIIKTILQRCESMSVRKGYFSAVLPTLMPKGKAIFDLLSEYLERRLLGVEYTVYRT